MAVISSIASWAATPPVTLYCSSKYAVDGIVEGLRREIRGRGVRVHSINPAPVATEWMSRAGHHQPGEHEPVPRSHGVPADWVAVAVQRALLGSRSSTRSVPWVAGLTRLAALPPVGAALDAVIGPLAPRLSRRMRAAVAERSVTVG